MPAEKCRQWDFGVQSWRQDSIALEALAMKLHMSFGTPTFAKHYHSSPTDHLLVTIQQEAMAIFRRASEILSALAILLVVCFI